ncbi:MAG: HEAT repeat domain-containing protein [Leptolyngbyaceae bacterium]|nr:HEAT repeat domain-containing protein [Leptolyngbyaceae bacterium]
MSDSLLVSARAAFDCDDWNTLIQCVREFLVQKHQGSQREQFVRLAVQSLVLADFETRWTLVPLISKFGHGAIAPLISALHEFDPDHPSEDETDWDLLWFIARILGNIPHPDAVAALVQVLQTSPSEDVVTAAIMALAEQGREAIDPLVKLLGHNATKAVAAQALAHIFVKDPADELRQTLMVMLQEPDAAVRATVLEALSHCHHAEITDCLLHGTQDQVASVRQAAVMGLGMQAHRLDQAAFISALQPRLWDTDAAVARQAAIALSRLQTAAVAAVLAPALNDSQFPAALKLEIVRALIWTNTPDGLQHLGHYLQTHTAKAEIYQEIAVMVGRVEAGSLHRQATELLLDILTHHSLTQQSAMLRQAIATSLGQLGQPEAKAALTQLTQDTDERVRLHAIAALKALP